MATRFLLQPVTDKDAASLLWDPKHLHFCADHSAQRLGLGSSLSGTLARQSGS